MKHEEYTDKDDMSLLEELDAIISTAGGFGKDGQDDSVWSSQESEMDLLEMLGAMPDDEDLSYIGELIGNEENIEQIPKEVKDDSKKGKIKEESLFAKLFKKKQKRVVRADMVSEDPDENEAILKEFERTEKERKKKTKKVKSLEEKKSKGKKKERLPKPVVCEEPSKPLPVMHIVLPLLMCFSLLVLIILGTSVVSYSYRIDTAESYFLRQKYNEAYECLAGMEIKEEDRVLYDRIRIIMKLDKQFDSYVNYKRLGYNTEALDSLIKGVGKYDDYAVLAAEAGVAAEFEDIRIQIEKALVEDFGIGFDQAKAMNSRIKVTSTE